LKKSTLKIHEGAWQRGTVDLKQKIYVSKLINLSQPDRDYIVFIVYVLINLSQPDRDYIVFIVYVYFI
jgi:hypothetical protein